MVPFQHNYIPKFLSMNLPKYITPPHLPEHIEKIKPSEYKWLCIHEIWFYLGNN